MSKDEMTKLSKHIFRLLKVTEIVYPIGRTNRGSLGLKFIDGQEDYQIFLDAVPLSTKDELTDENNIELKKMIDKYFLSELRPMHFSTQPSQGSVSLPIEPAPAMAHKNKGGRPKGSTNKNGNSTSKKTS